MTDIERALALLEAFDQFANAIEIRPHIGNVQGVQPLLQHLIVQVPELLLLGGAEGFGKADYDDMNTVDAESRAARQLLDGRCKHVNGVLDIICGLAGRGEIPDRKCDVVATRTDDVQIPRHKDFLANEALVSYMYLMSCACVGTAFGNPPDVAVFDRKSRAPPVA